MGVVQLPNPITNPQIQFTQHFIDNQFVDSVAKETFDVINPANEEVLAKLARGREADVNAAVSAAVKAFERNSVWRQMNATERGILLYKLAELLERDATYVASLMSTDNGKPFAESYDETMASIATIRFYAGAADKVNGTTIPTNKTVFAYTRTEPVGVCGSITPWNFPVLMVAVKLAPCLAMGNTLVLKPSEEAPLTALHIAALVREAGFPKGVFNVVLGFGVDAGQPLVIHKDIKKVTFTGSTAVGRLIQSEAGKLLKRVSLELGGKSPMIVFPDADLEKAVLTAHQGCMVNQGQCCCASTRIFVHEEIYDEFVKRSAVLANQRIVGDALDMKANIGPLINKRQFDKVVDLIESGVSQGAQLEAGGQPLDRKGFWIPPTVFSNVTDDMRIAREEIFGPVQQIFKFETTEEAIERANNTNYGLGAGVFTRDVGLAHYVSHSIDSGQVYVNCYFEGSIPLIPFGGFKDSGIGREFGLNGLDQYREIKSVIVKVDPIDV